MSTREPRILGAGHVMFKLFDEPETVWIPHGEGEAGLGIR